MLGRLSGCSAAGEVEGDQRKALGLVAEASRGLQRFLLDSILHSICYIVLYITCHIYVYILYIYRDIYKV